MKKILIIILISALVVLFGSQLSASGYSGKNESDGASGSMAEAVTHAEMARTCGNDAKKILRHAKTSLKYAKDAEKEAIEKINTQGVEHITTSITHLEEAIKHAKMGHVDIASTHVNEALNEMHQYTEKPVDYTE